MEEEGSSFQQGPSLPFVLHELQVLKSSEQARHG